MVTRCKRNKQRRLAKLSLCVTLAILVIIGGVGVLHNPLNIKNTKPKQPDALHKTTNQYDVPLSADLQKFIIDLCEQKQIPTSLVMAIIEQESYFDEDLISGTNDYGLMQINKVNHSWLEEKYGITDFLDPYQNVFCGITMIDEALELTEHDSTKALMIYNMGKTGAKNAWLNGVGSTDYTKSVLEKQNVYKVKEV